MFHKIILCSRLLIYADWDDSIFKAKVTKNSGSSLEVFGHNRGGCVYLHPEEALYLIEMVCKNLHLLLTYNEAGRNTSEYKFFFRKNEFFYEIHVNLVKVELNYINFFTLINTEKILNGLIYFNVIF